MSIRDRQSFDKSASNWVEWLRSGDFHLLGENGLNWTLLSFLSCISKGIVSR